MNEAWLIAAATLLGAVIVGAAAGWAVRSILKRPTRSSETQAIARAAGVFTFWFIVTVGIVAAVGALSPGSLEPLPGRVLAYLPRVLVAGLILIGGYALASAAALLLSHALSRASGERHHQIARGVRLSLLGAACIVALNQLGVDTTILTLVVAALLFGAAGAFALLVGLGGREVASQIAAGRYMRRVVKVGDAISTGEVTGVVAELHPAGVEVETPAEGRIHLPYSELLGCGFRSRPASPENGSVARADD
jgi:MFS family permease